MDVLEGSLSNTKFDENKDEEQIKGESDADNEENVDDDDTKTDDETKTSENFLHDMTPVVRTCPVNTYSSKYGADDEKNTNENAINNQETEVSDKFLNVHIPVVRTFPSRILLKTDLKVESDVHDDNLTVESNRFERERIELMLDDQQERKVKENIDYKSLNEYLNKHMRFLRSIDHNRQLSSYERKQLDKQMEDLKKLQEKLAKQVEENDRKHLYEKQKEDDILRKRRAYLQRRVEEAKLKESRKPRIQTTFRLSVHEKGSKSQMNQKKTKANRIVPSSSSDMNQQKSIVSYIYDVDSPPMSRYPNDVKCQTDANYFDRMDIEHRIDKFDKHYKEHPDDIGKNLKELITQFVEHSKQSWTNE